MTDDITSNEAAALVLFRKKLKDLNLDNEKNSDANLIRWLRARDLNLSQAESMLRNSLKWRAENDIDNILNWEAPVECAKLFPRPICGYDRKGRPVQIIPFRYLHEDAFWQFEKGKAKQDYIRFEVQEVERILLAAKKYSTPERPIFQMSAIYDLDQFNLQPYVSKRYMDFAQPFNKVLEDNFPECVHKIYVLHTPKIASVLFSMAKLFIAKRTAAKIAFYGSNRDSWISDLLKDIPADQLPERYGGTNTEFEKVAYQGFVLPDGVLDPIMEEKFTKVNVSPRSTFALDFDVKNLPATLNWYFRTDCNNIEFFTQFNGSDLSNYGRVDSHLRNQQGIIVCQETGTYTLVFDNRFSKFRSKTVRYFVDLESTTVN